MMAFIHLMNKEGVKKEFLCCKELPEEGGSGGYFDFMSSYLEGTEFSLKRFMGICPDGIPSTTGAIKDFVTLGKEYSPKYFNRPLFFAQPSPC